MTAASKPQAPPVDFDLVVPAVRFPVNLAAHLEDVMRPMFRAEPVSAPRARRFRCQLVDGEGLGATVRVLGFDGFLGFEAEEGLLHVSVPRFLAGTVQERFAHLLRNRVDVTATNEVGQPVNVAEFWLELRPGARATLPLGFLGELALEAA